MWTVLAKLIQILAFHSLNNFFLVSYQLVFPLLGYYWPLFIFFIINNLNFPRHENGRSSIRVHDMAGKSAVYYPHLEGSWFIAKSLSEGNSRDPQISRMWNVKLECAKLFSIHVHDRNSKFYVIDLLLSA